VNNRGTTGTFAAGTSADPPGTTAPTQGAHVVRLTFAVAAGTTGEVTIDWEAEQTAGASVTSAVDVDGDGVPDFEGTGAANARVTLPVTAGTKGFVIDITTSGSATVTGTGRESYEASLTVLLETSRFSWSPSGPECLGSLTATANTSRSNARLEFVVTGGAPNAIGVFFAGALAAAPLSLPAGSCQLLVDPGTAQMLVFLTDVSGNAQATLRTRARSTTMEFQVLTMGFLSGALGTTNALHLTIN
jgi:hypothetical protein